METKKIIHCAIILACPLLTYIFSAPEGLSVIGWHLFGVYVGTILAIILKPYPAPVVLLAAVGLSSIILANTAPQIINGKEIAISQKAALDGYKSSTTWLVFSAFAMSSAFVLTGLGKRIAYKMIGAVGSTTLRLGYVNAFLDLLISPAMPSTTARGGGIMRPIMNSVAVSLGSEPDNHPKRVGQYLMVNTYMVVKTTGYMSLTAMAPNALAMDLMEPILGIRLDWMQWFLAALAPGMLALIMTPFVLYMLNTPELKKVDNKAIAKQGLEEMGPMSRAEKTLVFIFLGAIICWVFGKQLHLKSSTVAITAMALLPIFSVMKWDDILNNKSAWSTLTWYGGLLGVATVLKKSGFFTWLADVMQTSLNFGDTNAVMATIVILILSVAVRYLFASGAAYVASMVPVFAAVGLAAGANPLLLTLGLLFSNCYGSMVTHYGSGPAPVIFGAGYNSLKSWWLSGATIAFGTLAIHCTLGFAWWKLLDSLNVFGG